MTLFDIEGIAPAAETKAVLSLDTDGPDGRGFYRYELRRIWDAGKPLLVWVMLNPSTADETKNDPTITRCIDFAKRWGYGGIVVVNLFAARATDPAALTKMADPVGPENLTFLQRLSGHDVVCAWGSSIPSSWTDWADDVRERLAGRSKIHHLGLTKGGHPRHPLYLRGDTQLTEWVA